MSSNHILTLNDRWQRERILQKKCLEQVSVGLFFRAKLLTNHVTYQGMVTHIVDTHMVDTHMVDTHRLPHIVDTHMVGIYG